MAALQCCTNQNFRDYRNSENYVIGKCCNNCGVEFFRTNNVPHVAAVPPQDLPDGNTFEKKDPIIPTIRTAFQTATQRTRIRNADMLQLGDHVAWQRAVSYWHEAIVTRIDGNIITTISWTRGDGENGIFEIQEPDTCFDQMYRFEYPPNILQENSTDLVLARARSRLTSPGVNNEEDAVFYDLLNDNCESFATYCKTGHAQSHQVRWLKKTFNEILCVSCSKSITKGGFTFAAVVSEVAEESLEQNVGFFQSIGIGIAVLIVIEFVLTIVDICSILCDHTENTSANFKRAECTRRVCEGVFAVLFSFMFSTFFDFFSGCLHDHLITALCRNQSAVIFFTVVTLLCGWVTGILVGVIGGYVVSKSQAANCSRRSSRSYLLTGIFVGIISGGFIGCVGGAIGGVIGVALGEWSANPVIAGAAIGCVIGVSGGFFAGGIGIFFGPRCWTTHGWIILAFICITSGVIAGVIGGVFSMWDNKSRSRAAVSTFDVFLGLIGGIAGGVLGRLVGNSCGSKTGNKCCPSDDPQPANDIQLEQLGSLL